MSLLPFGLLFQIEKREKSMKVIVCENYDQASEKCAEIFAEQLKAKPDSIVGLATGSTPIGTYKALTKKYENGEISFKRVKVFNLDEYYGIPKTHDQSYAYFMKDNLFDHVDIDQANCNIEDGMAKDYEAECKRYDDLQAATCDGLDVQLLGIGPNGHVGFNEPADFFTAGTHRVELEDSTIEANARFFASKSDVPTSALTVGMKTIMSAKHVVLIATGAAKIYAVNAMLNGPVTPKVPASILQLHPNVTVIVDKAAMGK